MGFQHPNQIMVYVVRAVSTKSLFFFVYMCMNTNIDGFSSLLQIVYEASYERLIEQGIIYIHNFIVLGLAMHLFGAMWFFSLCNFLLSLVYIKKICQCTHCMFDLRMPKNSQLESALAGIPFALCYGVLFIIRHIVISQ